MPAVFFRFSDITDGRCLMIRRQREAFNYKDNRCSKVASLASLCVIEFAVSSLYVSEASKRYGGGSELSFAEVAMVTDPYGH